MMAAQTLETIPEETVAPSSIVGISRIEDLGVHPSQPPCRRLGGMDP